MSIGPFLLDLACVQVADHLPNPDSAFLSPAVNAFLFSFTWFSLYMCLFFSLYLQLNSASPKKSHNLFFPWTCNIVFISIDLWKKVDAWETGYILWTHWIWSPGKKKDFWLKEKLANSDSLSFSLMRESLLQFPEDGSPDTSFTAAFLNQMPAVCAGLQLPYSPICIPNGV